MAPDPPRKPRRILLITSVLPWPIHRNGGAQRTDLLRGALEIDGSQVDILALAPRPGPELPAESELRRHGVVAHFTVDLVVPPQWRPGFVPAALNALWSLPHVRRTWQHRYRVVPEVSQWLHAHEAAYDVIYVRYLQTALLAGLDQRSPTAPPPVVVDMDDVDWLTLQSRLEAQPWPGMLGTLGMSLALRTVRKRCQRALMAFNGFFVASEDDAIELRRLGRHPMVLPNIPHPEAMRGEPPRPSPEQGRTVLFVGDLEFAPNATGLDWFLEQCWAQIRAQVPDARLRIVGRGLSDERRTQWAAHPAVDVVGFAEDLRGEYATAACTIGPTWWGGGTKIKIVESAAMGRPCVVTPHALRGFEYLAEGPSPAVVVAGEAAAFAQAVVELLRDPSLRREMGDAGLVLAARHATLDRFQRVVADSLRQLRRGAR